MFQVRADDAHVLIAGDVDVAEKAALRQGLAAHGLVAPGVIEKFADAVNAGAGELLGALPDHALGHDIGADAGEILGIFVHQGVHVVGRHRAGGETAEVVDLDLEQVGAQLFKLLVHHLLHTVAQTGDDDDRAHANDDAQHGEKGPHLAGHQGLERQAEGLGEIHTAAPSPAFAPSKPAPSSPLSSSGWTTALGSWASPS